MASGKPAQRAFAGRKVIITAGTMASARLLLLSGMGPADELSALGMQGVADNPQVGKNFQDHLMIALTARAPGIASLLRHAKGGEEDRGGLAVATFHDGAVDVNVLEAGGFFDAGGDGRLDTQLFMQPVYDMQSDKEGLPLPTEIPDGLTIKVANVRPESRGEIRLASADPAAAPLAQANYLSEPGDLEGHIRAMRLGLKFFEAPSLRRIVEDVSPAAASDAALAAFFKRLCTTQFHPVSSCRMGAGPDDSAVN